MTISLAKKRCSIPFDIGKQVYPSREDSMAPDTEVVQAMLDQALAEARSRGARRITELHLVMYDPSEDAERALRGMLRKLSSNTLAKDARIVTHEGPNSYICWNCCGLRFESSDPDAICPNCGHSVLLIPSDVTFALEHIEFA
jgi:Zn finger protein HypA/HybF involved in hydrogenase expression